MSEALNVLVVSEKETDSQLMESLSTAAGRKISASRVGSIEEMHRAIAGETWDLVIYDFGLRGPGIGEILIPLRAIAGGPALVVIAEEYTEDDLLDCMRAGAKDFVRKGDKERLARTIERALKDAGHPGRESSEYSKVEASDGEIGIDQFHSQKMEALGVLAGEIAHDFNNLLTCILGYTEICMRCADIEDQVHEGLNQIFAASLRARDLVSQILMFGRKQPIEKKQVNLAYVITEALGLLRSCIPPNVSVVSLLPKQELEILADRSQILQVLLNLCTNAIQAMEGRGGKLTLSLNAILVGSDPVDNPPESAGRSCARLTVADTGVGMGEDTIRRIFEPFFTTKRVGHGTGLGLSMVRGIVERHGGFMQVESKPGDGSQFHVYLPLMEDCAVAERGNPVLKRGLRGHGERVLVIDDDKEVAELAVRILEAYSYKASAITDPQRALEQVRKYPDATDLVLTDLIMPELAGPEVVRAIKLIKPELPVLLVSGFASSLTEEAARGEGFSGLIHKPFRIENFAEVVARALADPV
jgi:signal transduction histidine kinase